MKYVIVRILDGNGDGIYFTGLLSGAISFAELEQAKLFNTQMEAENFFTKEKIDALGLSVEIINE